jgi:hypothetical protein
MRNYEVRPRKDKRGVDLISEALPFGALWYGGPNAIENAASYAIFNSGGKSATIRIFDHGGLLMETRTSDRSSNRSNTLGAL